METYKPYFCFLGYYATGEGLTYVMALVGSESEDAAKRKFVRKYMCDEFVEEEHIQKCVEYFSRWVVVHDFRKESNHEKIKEVLKQFVTQAVMDNIFDAEKEYRLHEFYFKIYTNYS